MKKNSLKDKAAVVMMDDENSNKIVIMIAVAVGVVVVIQLLAWIKLISGRGSQPASSTTSQGTQTEVMKEVRLSWETLDSMMVYELQALCKQRGLPVSGLKLMWRVWNSE